MRLRPVGAHWRARLVCALTIAALVGTFSYTATYRALIVISTPSGTAATSGTPHAPDAPSTASTTATSTTAPVALQPGH